MKTSGLNVALLIQGWTERAFLFRSSYYTGRDANCGDLNSRMLEQIYLGIQVTIGKAEATNFAQFVNSLTDLSASAFIQAFEEFWYSGCQLTKLTQDEAARNQLTGSNENELMGEAMALIAGVFGGRRLSSTDNLSASYRVKSEFVWRHKAEIGEDNIRSVTLTPYGY